MSTSQFHGKVFEREVIRTCFGVDPDSISPDEVFDIPLGIACTQLTPLSHPVSIKTFKRVNICLSDARRIWAWQGSLMLVLGLYVQAGGVKRVVAVHELVLSMNNQTRTLLFGSVSLAEVKAFHDSMALSNFPRGTHSAARALAQATKASMASRLGCIQLNPKIDSKTQRRLQCSARLDCLIGAASSASEHRGNYRGLPLPFEIQSSSRIFSS
jgi:hypothetical protein